jgi:hypothetical protein
MPKPVVYVDVRTEPAELAAARIAALQVWCAAGGEDAAPPCLAGHEGGEGDAAARAPLTPALVERLFASPKPVRLLALRWDARDAGDPDAAWRGPGEPVAFVIEPIVPGSALAAERAQWLEARASRRPLAALRDGADPAAGVLVSGDLPGEALLLRVAYGALEAFARDYYAELPALAMRTPIHSPLMQAVLARADPPFRADWLTGVTDVVFFGRMSAPGLSELSMEDRRRANEPPADPPDSPDAPAPDARPAPPREPPTDAA